MTQMLVATQILTVFTIIFFKIRKNLRLKICVISVPK